MESVAQLVMAVGKTFTMALLSPLFILLIILIGWQYRRMQKMTAGDNQIQLADYLQPMLVSTAAGILGGFLGSLLLVFFGIDLAGMGLLYIFLIALLLMLIHPRFICFAYAGGIVSLAHIIIGIPDIEVAQVMGLVAILHMIESLLILLTGHLNSVPVYCQRDDGSIVGGFNLQKFWPIPLVAMMSSGLVSSPMAGGNWWPIINQGPDFLYGLTGNLVPVLAILGYGEITTTSRPARKSRASAFFLAIYSVVLLGLSVLGSHFPSLIILPALFGPLGHEMVIAIGVGSERKRTPIFVEPSRGVMVLDVLTGSPAMKAGLRSGDIIVSVNGEEIINPRHLQGFLRLSWGDVMMVVERNAKLRYLSLFRRPSEPPGIIPVPDRNEYACPPASGNGVVSTLFFWLKRLLG